MGNYTLVQMSLLEDSPAKTSAEQEQGQDLTGREAASGARCSELLMRFGHSGSSSKTQAPCAVTALHPSCKIYGRSGSMRNGTLSQQPPLVPATSAKERGLLQTPTVEDAKRRGSLKAWRKYLQEKHTSSCRLRNQAAHLDRRDGYLNAEWIALLMMFPAGWAKLPDMETQ